MAKYDELAADGGTPFGKQARAAGVEGAKIEAADIGYEVESWTGVAPVETGPGSMPLEDVPVDPEAPMGP